MEGGGGQSFFLDELLGSGTAMKKGPQRIDKCGHPQVVRDDDVIWRQKRKRSGLRTHQRHPEKRRTLNEAWSRGPLPWQFWQTALLHSRLGAHQPLHALSKRHTL
uniref:Uncharacterized protein n=1 Tax=Ascaris lumbricoides TaxID=6252 RepID=A0A0M3I1C9_ASCLU